MTRSRLHGALGAAVVALVTLAGSPGWAAPGAASCQGHDLLPEIAGTSADAAKRIEKATREAINGEALLWRVSRPGSAASHLFGTVHLSDERVTHLPAAVEQAFAGAKRLVLEIGDLSPEALGGALGRLGDKLVFRDGRSLNALLTPDELPVARDAVTKAGVPAGLIAVARPWLVTMLLALSDCERERIKSGKTALDLLLAERARARGVPVVGLESIDDQLNAMAAVPEADQLTVLKASIKLQATTNDMIETMLQRYLAREIGKVWPLQAEMWRRAGFNDSAFASFQRELVTVRNARMRDAALPLLAEGQAFIAVGALHLIGKDGLVALLRNAGYEVVPAEQPPF